MPEPSGSDAAAQFADEFADYLRSVEGLAELTIDAYAAEARRYLHFLAALPAATDRSASAAAANPVLAYLTARREGGTPGDGSVLERYRRWRAPDHAAVARFTDGLVDLFGHRCSPVAPLRAPALVALDLAPVLKRALARRAMGLAGRVPRLTLGLRP